MTVLLVLIPRSLCLDILGSAPFPWSPQNGQLDDPADDAERVPLDVENKSLPSRRASVQTIEERTT